MKKSVFFSLPCSFVSFVPFLSSNSLHILPRDSSWYSNQSTSQTVLASIRGRSKRCLSSPQRTDTTCSSYAVLFCWNRALFLRVYRHLHVKSATHFHLLPNLRKCGALPPPIPCAFVLYTGQLRLFICISLSCYFLPVPCKFSTSFSPSILCLSSEHAISEQTGGSNFGKSAADAGSDALLRKTQYQHDGNYHWHSEPCATTHFVTPGFALRASYSLNPAVKKGTGPLLWRLESPACRRHHQLRRYRVNRVLSEV